MNLQNIRLPLKLGTAIIYPPNVLHLTLKKKWFEMICAGEKKEEYREIKPYWENRLIDQKRQTFLDAEPGCQIAWKNYEYVVFKNGYAKDAPEITIELEGIEFGTAKPEWSDNWKGDVFVLKLGRILERNNINI